MSYGGIPIKTAQDGNGIPIGFCLDTRIGSLAHYKVYGPTLTQTTVLDGFNDLGRLVTRGYIKNYDNTNGFTIQFSVDGTTYGDSITFGAGYSLDLNYFIMFKKVKLTWAADAAYEVLLA